LYGDILKKIIRLIWYEILGTIFVFYHVCLPKNLRKLLSPTMDKVSLWGNSIVTFLRHIRQESYIISGKCRGDDIKVLYIGKNIKRLYMMKLAGIDEVEVRRLGRIYIWNLRERIDNLRDNVDVVIAEINRCMAQNADKSGFLLIPEWVNFTLQVPDSLEVYTHAANKSLKNDIRKAKKYKYSFEITNDPEKLSLFYHRMYTPFIRKRHSFVPHIADFSLMKRIFTTGALIFMKERDEYVGGHFLILRDNTLWAKWLGIKDGSEEYLRRGVSGATNYFIIKWAIENKYEMIDFGLCRAFYNDGVFRFKKKWGMIINNFRLNTMFWGLKIYRFNEGVKNFLEDNPFLFYRDGRLEGFVFLHEGCQSEKDVAHIYKNFLIPGISRLNLLCLGEGPHEFQEIIETEYPQLNLINRDFFNDAR
jgi:hypothetical protein